MCSSCCRDGKRWINLNYGSGCALPGDKQLIFVMEISIIKILEYRDLFPNETKLDVPAILRRFSRERLIRAINVLGMNYGNAYMPDTTFFTEISVNRVKELNKRFEKYAPHLLSQRICYCTHRTILELLRIVFSIPLGEYRGDGEDEDFEYELFIVVLQLNENLMAFTSKDDDLSSPSYLQELYDNVAPDTVSLCYPYAFNDGEIEKQLSSYGVTDAYNYCTEHKCNKLTSMVRKYFSGPCMKLIPMSFIQDRRFDVRFKNGEDSLFMFLISDKIKKFAFTSKDATYYRRYRL